MSAPPYMKLYVAEYLAETTILDVVGHGAYLLLLMAMWRKGGKLARTDDNLRRIAQCSPEQWAAVKDDVLSHFKVSGGSIKHDRLSKEIAKYDAVVNAASEAGKASAAKRASKNKDKTPNVRSENVERKSNQPEPEPEPERIGVGVSAGANDPDDWPVGKATDHAAFLAKINPHLDPNKRAGLVTSVGEIARWRQLGCSWDLDVIPAVIAHASKPGSSLVGTWTYFGPAIARSHAERNRPPEAVELENPRERPRHPTGKFDRHQSNLERAVAGSEIAAGLRALKPESSF